MKNKKTQSTCDTELKDTSSFHNVNQRSRKWALMILNLSLVPVLPPSDVIAQGTGTSTILLLWGPVPEHGVLGIIVGYDVAYTRLSDTAGPKKAACSTPFWCELKNLDFGTCYTIFVSGVTSKGVGANASVEAVTFKAGKDCVELFETKTVLGLGKVQGLFAYIIARTLSQLLFILFDEDTV